MAVAFAEFVSPYDGGVVEQCAGAAGFGDGVEFFDQLDELLAEPDVDFHKLLLRVGIVVRLMGEAVVVFVDIEPAHSCLADAIGILQGGDTCHAVGEGTDEEVDLHFADLGYAVVVEGNPGLERGWGEDEVLGAGTLQILFQIADEAGVLFQ